MVASIPIHCVFHRAFRLSVPPTLYRFGSSPHPPGVLHALPTRLYLTTYVSQSIALTALLVMFLGVGAQGKQFYEMSSLGAMGSLEATETQQPQMTKPQLVPFTTRLRKKVAVD